MLEAHDHSSCSMKKKKTANIKKITPFCKRLFMGRKRKTKNGNSTPICPLFQPAAILAKYLISKENIKSHITSLNNKRCHHYTAEIMHYGKHVQKKAFSEKCWTQDIINFYNMDKLVAAENGQQA